MSNSKKRKLILITLVASLAISYVLGQMKPTPDKNITERKSPIVSSITLKKANINGTFVNVVHAMSKASNNIFKFSIMANKLKERNYAWDFVNGTCNNKYFAIGPHERQDCGSMSVEIDYSTAKATLPPTVNHGNSE